jgi:hypothetical protein
VPTMLHAIRCMWKREDFMFAHTETILESTQKVNELRKFNNLCCNRRWIG